MDGTFMRKIGCTHQKTIEKRRKTAKACRETMKHETQAYVDEMDDKVMVAYAAWPERLYLVGKDGRIEIS